MIRRRGALAIAAGVASLVHSSSADAAGLYFSDRGVRPMGRAGAFVAGADDVSAIWYNPAGLSDVEGPTILADFAWLKIDTSYARQLRIVDADGTVRNVNSPEVTGTSPVLPIPTIAGAFRLPSSIDPKQRWTFAGGFFAPYVALVSYPATVNGQPSPARYALGSYDGSALGQVGVWAAYKASEEWRFGLGVTALVGVLQTNVTFSASPPDRLLAAPEQPEFDADARLKIGPIVAPSANAGVTWVPGKLVRVGLSAQAPTYVSAPAEIKVKLPQSAVFDGASVSGSDAQVRFWLPPVIRAGIELRPNETLRLEASFVREFWSIHDRIQAEPDGVAIDGLTGLPSRLPLPTIHFPRNFTDASSYRFGAEHRFQIAPYALDLRAGVAFEESAVPNEYVSLFSLDTQKVIVSLGGSLHIGRFRLDATFAHLFASSVFVAPDRAAVGRVNPLAGNAPFEAVNGGRYDITANLIGMGLVYRL